MATMTREEFIQKIAVLVQEYAPRYDIQVYSPIIAQAVLESAGGTSELAVNANNFFGLKYKVGRCPTANGIYRKAGSEQNQDGSYTSSSMLWCQFPNMEACVIGYFDFISHSRYANLKGVKDPKEYLENIKKDGYATSINYVTNLMNVINTYNLTRFDKSGGNKVSNPIIALSAGHGLYTGGKRCDIRIDPNETREWWLNDRICDIVEEMLKSYNCTVVRVNDTTGKVDTALQTRADISNNANADIYLAVHHNAAGRVFSGGGTVVFYYPTGNGKQLASSLYEHIVKRTNLVGDRSQKIIGNTQYYELKLPKATSFIIENGFMDSKVDVPIILSESHAKKTAEGIVAFLVENYELEKNGYVANVKVPTVDNTTKPSNPIQLREYVVKKHDTLSKIGNELGIDWKKISELNGIKPPYIIKAGQVLSLPTSENSEVYFKVKLKDNLNIRRTPGGVIHKKNGAKKGIIYTIVAVENNWGLLKSYQKDRNGWISISDTYVTRV